jgi:hypothetical protein
MLLALWIYFLTTSLYSNVLVVYSDLLQLQLTHRGAVILEWSTGMV